MRHFTNLIQALQAAGFSTDLTKEDGIPYLEVWRGKDLMTFALAKSLAQQVRDGAAGSVHFHKMTGDAVAFFIYPAEMDPEVDVDDLYGVPVDTWLANVDASTKEQFTMRGHFDEGDIVPTQATGHWGFIWERPNDFYSTDQTGKWCVVRNASDIDALWAQVRQAVRDGKFRAALVSSPRQAATHGNTYVICAFTRDWQDKADVDAAREVLRNFGVTEELGYKRDVDTVNGVYGTPEEWTYRG